MVNNLYSKSDEIFVTNLLSIDSLHPLIVNSKLAETKVHLHSPVCTPLQVDHVDLVHSEAALLWWRPDKYRQLLRGDQRSLVSHDFHL